MGLWNNGIWNNGNGSGGSINIITQSITQNDITHAPSSDAVFNALSNKIDTTLQAGEIIVGDATNKASSQALSGDATLNENGVLTIEDDAITTNKIIDDAITTDKIANQSITGSKIADGTITGSQMGASISLSGSPTTTTQPQNDSSTKIATTEFVSTGLSTKANLVPSPTQNHILLTNNTGNPIDSGKIFNDGGTTLNDVFTASKVLSIISTLPTGSGSGVTLYLSSEASLNSYQTLSRTPTNAPLSIATAAVSFANPKVFLKGFLSPVLGITKLNSALWTFNLYASCNVVQDTTTLSIEAYTYSATGVETLLFTADSGDINFTIATQITFEPTTIQYNINTTDRLLIKVYAKSDHNNDVSVSLYYDKVPEGLNTNANSHIHTPISVPHNQQEGLNDGDYKHLTASQYAEATGYSSSSANGLLLSTDYQKFDNKQSKITSPTNNNIATTDAVGQTKDSGFSINNTNPFNLPSNTQIADAQSTYNLITQIANSSKGLQPVKLYLNTNQVLSGLPTQGGYTCVAGDRVICTAQTSSAQNLIYVVSNGAWTIANDSVSVEDLLGSWTSITEGTYLGDYTYLVSITPPNGTSAPTSVEWSTPVNQSLYDAGIGLSLTGGTFSISNTAVISGGYFVAGKSIFSVNSQGQLTSASNVSVATSDLSNINESETTDSQILIYKNSDSKYENKNISGDATLSNTGALTIGAGAITGSKIENNVALAGNPTTTTQTANNNSTRIATTEYTDRGLNTKANLVSTPTDGNILITNSTGQSVDSGKKFDDTGTGLNDILSANEVLTQINQAVLSVSTLPNVDFSTTTNDTLTGLSARDGYTPTAGKFCLVKNQTNKSNNGVWITSAGAWSRAKYDSVNNTYLAVSTETTYSQLNIQSGIVNISNGTVNKNLQFQITISNPNLTFGNTDIVIISKTTIPVGSVFNRFVDSTIGNDTNNNGSSSFPFLTINKALEKASFPCVLTITGQSLACPSTLTSSKNNLTIQTNDTKDLGGKTILTGQITTSTGFTRFALTGANIQSGSLPCVSFGQGDEGMHSFEDVYLTTSGTELMSFDTSFKNEITLKNVSSKNSPTASLNLPNLTGTATLYISGSSTALSLGTIGNGWVVVILPDANTGAVEIKGAISSSAVFSDLRDGIKLMSSLNFIANQTELNTLKANTNPLTNGLYIPQFLNPVATNGTYAKGDLFFKGTLGEAPSPVIPFVLRFALYEDLTAISVGTGQASTTYIKSGSGIWSQPSSGSTTLTGDITGSGTGSIATIIANNVVSNSKLTQVGANTYKGNNTGATANATDIATNTAFNQSFETSTANIKANGSVSAGSLSTIARADHIHPTDTTRLSTTLASTNIFVGNLSNVATGVAMSGDATISNAGVLTIGSAKITGSKIANGTITADNIANSTIRGSEVAPSIALAGSPTTTTALAGDNSTKIATTAYVDTLASGNIKIGNLSNVATGVAMSGDATIDNTGALTIANNVVSNAKLSQMTANTLKGNNTGVSANANDLTATQVRTLLGLATTDTPTFAGMVGSSFTSSGTNTLTLNSGSTGAVNLGTNANAKTINIGSNIGTSSVLVNTGTGGFTVYSPVVSILLKVDGVNGITASIIEDPNPYSSATDIRMLKYDFSNRVTFDTVAVPSSGTNTMSINANGNLQGLSSDIRLKNVIGLFAKSLETARLIQTKEFIWKFDENNPNATYQEKIQAGFIAQELKEILPEAVPTLGAFKNEDGTKDEDNPQLGFNPTPIIALLINCVKDLDKKNQDLENRLQALENRIKILENK